jgi:transposase
MKSTVFGVGIDTARYGHHVSFVDQDIRPATNPYHFKEDQAGYDKLKKSLLALAKKSPDAQIRVCIDPAGIYGNNLTQFLKSIDLPNLTVSVAHPETSKDYRKLVVGHKKADASDSWACARYAVKENPEPTPQTPPQLDSLRRCVSELEATATERTMLVNQLHNLLASVFPELAVYLGDIASSYCLKLLAKYPTAKRIAVAKLESILSIPHMKEDIAKAVHRAAKLSVGRSDEIVEALVEQKVKQIQSIEQHQQILNKTLQKSWDSLPNDAPYKQLLTICGFGLQTAASIVAKVMDIKRFESPSKLIGYFGIYPTLYESGTTKDGSAKRESVYGMARQGNDMVRRNLYMAAQAAALHNPAVKALYARQRQLGKEHGVAIGHCMAKLLRIAYALWVKIESYQPDFEAKQKEKNVVGPNVKEVKPQKQEVTTTPTNISAAPSPSKRKPLNYAILKTLVNIDDVLAAHHWEQRTSRGAQMRGACPLCAHQDERAFSASRSKNVYCCHRCGGKGNALELLTELSKASIHEACWDWIDREGLTPPIL